MRNFVRFAFLLSFCMDAGRGAQKFRVCVERRKVFLIGRIELEEAAQLETITLLLPENR